MESMRRNNGLNRFRLVPIRQEYNRRRYDKQDPEKLTFEFDREHQPLIIMGLDFGLEPAPAPYSQTSSNDVPPPVLRT